VREHSFIINIINLKEWGTIMGYEDYEAKPNLAYYVIIALTGFVVLMGIGLIVLGVFGIFT
jgi:hypothetical protein